MENVTELEIEEMTYLFMNRNGIEKFKRFGNKIKSYCHSDKWSVTYDFMHDNFVFDKSKEDDGKIITKFVELVEKNKL